MSTSSLPPDHSDRMERARLSLDGLWVGDSLGQRFFYPPTHMLLEYREPPNPPWPHTDDTEMALAILEVIEEHGAIDQDRLAWAFARRYRWQPNRGYGATAHVILSEINAGTPWRQAAQTAFDGQGSMGNGVAVFLSADGRHALSGSEDGTLKLWETATGTCLHTISGHRRGIASVALSSDWHYALTGSLDTTLKLWETATGQCLRTFEGHTMVVNAVCLGRDGRLALSGSDDNTAKLWEIDTGRCLRTLEGHASGVWRVRLSRDGRHGLSRGALEGDTRLWELETGRCLRTFRGAERWESLAEIHPDGSWQLGWDVVAPAMLCRAQPGEKVLEARRTCRHFLDQARQHVRAGHPEQAARFLREARALPGYSRQPEVFTLWTQLYRRLPRTTLHGGWELRVLRGHTDEVTSVCLSADGRLVLSGSRDKTLRLWETESGKCLHTLAGHAQGVTAVCLSPDRRLAVSGSLDHSLRLWDLESGRCLYTIEGYQEETTLPALLEKSLDAAEDMAAILLPLVEELRQPLHKRVSSWREEARREQEKGERRRNAVGHTGPIVAVCFSPDGRRLLSASSDQTLRLWEAATSRRLGKYEGHTGRIGSLALSVDGRRTLTASADKTLRLWDVASGRCLRIIMAATDERAQVCLSVDGRFALLSGTYEGHHVPQLWDVHQGRCVRQFADAQNAPAVCLSLDGRFALFGNWGGTVQLWEVATGRCLRSFAGHTQVVNSVCLSTDGRIAVSGSRDGTVRLWALDWDLDEKPPADWDEGARLYSENFLARHMASGSILGRLWKRLRGASPRPGWTEADFEQLLDVLGCAGYGWLRPEGVRRALEALAAHWRGPQC